MVRLGGARWIMEGVGGARRGKAGLKFPEIS
jgi:hypothetical protein